MKAMSLAKMLNQRKYRKIKATTKIDLLEKDNVREEVDTFNELDDLDDDIDDDDIDEDLLSLDSYYSGKYFQTLYIEGINVSTKLVKLNNVDI